MEEEEVKIVEEGRVQKIKAKIDEEIRRLMEARKKKPRFIRQQLWQFKKLDDKWRRPRGRHSKQRRHYKYRPPLPRVGYGTPRVVRGLHPSGFKERMVYNVRDLEGIDREREAIRIGGTVGRRKREEIIAKANEMGIRVLNRRL